jgi:hypothetical protein
LVPLVPFVMKLYEFNREFNREKRAKSDILRL